MITVSKTATGKRIDKLMRESGISQREMSKRTGLSENTIYNYRNGWSMPSVEKLAMMALVLGCGLDDIVCYGKGVDKGGSDRPK